MTPDPKVNNPLTLQPGVCPVCLRAECGAGYAAKGRGYAPVFTCEADLPLAEAAFRARATGLLHRYEAESLRAAGATAGNWLLQHGETDLKKLTTPAWEFFVGLLLKDFADQMRARLATPRA